MCTSIKKRQRNILTYWFIGMIMLVAFAPSVHGQMPGDVSGDVGVTLLRPSEWLDRYGVGVYYTANYIAETEFTALELPMRLYAQRLGYPLEWNVSTGREMRNKVVAGFEDLEFYPNNGFVAPQQGDILLWSEHAAIINKIETDEVEVIQQNVWSSPDANGQAMPRATHPFTKTVHESYRIDGTIGWIHSPHMPDLLNDRLSPIGIVGDWDGDGKDTVGVYNPVTAAFYLRNNNEYGVPDILFYFGTPLATWIPITGDWNGDGRDSVGLYDPVSSMYYLKNETTSGKADLSFQYGPENEDWWEPTAGDWNNDQVDSIGIYDQRDRYIYLNNRNATIGREYYYPYGPRKNNWKPLAGDWNGDGIDSAGFYTPDEEKFLLKNNHNVEPADITVYYGDTVRNWKPLAGDWDGDGIDTIGLYSYESGTYPETHLFHLRSSNDENAKTQYVNYYMQYTVIIPLRITK